jgi:polyribonucleotide nucleotidyltransferase
MGTLTSPTVFITESTETESGISVGHELRFRIIQMTEASNALRVSSFLSKEVANLWRVCLSSSDSVLNPRAAMLLEPM